MPTRDALELAQAVGKHATEHELPEEQPEQRESPPSR